jgi:hypothetical protein
MQSTCRNGFQCRRATDLSERALIAAKGAGLWVPAMDDEAVGSRAAQRSTICGTSFGRSSAD